MGKSKRNKDPGKLGPKERQKRRMDKHLKKTQSQLDKAIKEARKMTGLVGPDGKTPLKVEGKKISYQAGGLKFDSTVEPDAMLLHALTKSKQSVGNNVFTQVLQNNGTELQAQLQATTAANGVTDPFAMEPCAAAVFMYLSREIEYRDKIIAQLVDRVVALGADPVDMTHPYPLPSQPGAPKAEPAADETTRLEVDDPVAS